MREDKFYYEENPSAPDQGSQNLDSDVQIWPRALIIDQFEELFTKHEREWQKREDFFYQLDLAMKHDPYLWVILTLREEHLAALDPYAHLLEDKFRTRYYMERMAYPAALEAVKKPVEKIRPFSPGVAEALVENLTTGKYVEPVQLQVVCYQLWTEIKDAPGNEITQKDLQTLAKGEDLAGFINNALAEFYEDAIAIVIQDPELSVGERFLRKWFSTELITENETRDYVFQGEKDTAGLPNEAVAILQDKYIVRIDRKPRGNWVELVHDRFVSPILQANRKWEAVNQNPILLDAEKWADAGEDPKQLYSGTQLSAAVDYFTQHPTEKTPLVEKFLDKSEGIENQKASLRQRRLLGFSFGALIIFGVLLIWSVFSTIRARENFLVANTNLEAAVEAENAALKAENAARKTGHAAQTSEAGAYTQAAVYKANISIYGTQLVDEWERSTAQVAAFENTLVAARATPTPGIGTQEMTQDFTPTPDLQGTQIAAAQTVEANPIKIHSIGKSVRGQTLEVTQLGTGSNDIMLVGGIHSAFAPSSVVVAEHLRVFFLENLQEIPAEFSLHILTNANPDAQGKPGTMESRLNGNGVDLNRNWDCAWAGDARWLTFSISGGSSPFSEPETRALRDYILKIRPVAVVFYEARSPGGLTSPGGCGVTSLFSEPLAKSYGGTARYRVAPFEAYAVNGDGTNYLDAQGIPAISVLLPEYEYDENSRLFENIFKANLDAVLNLLSH
jgi:hypothetical protein